MQALSSGNLNLRNISEADDSRLMQNLLSSKSETLNANNAGTVFRFLTAYFSVQNGKEVVLTGSERMLQRPIKPLVKALRKLGANIEYLGEEGFPPLKIKGRKLKKKKIKIDASQSSQFASALLLIAPYVEGGIKLELKNPTSVPYIDMTLQLLKLAGVPHQRDENSIRVKEGEYKIDKPYTVEADWSSAAFIYQCFALTSFGSLTIKDLKEDSLQGDSKCVEIFESLGISSDFNSNGLLLKRHSFDAFPISIDLKDQPDLILPFIVSAAFLLPSIRVTGISTLRIKESNRVEALKEELSKLAELKWEEEEDVLKLSIASVKRSVECFSVGSHSDHRIAMSIAPLTMLYQCLDIDDPSVVIKSFPNYWKEIAKLGIQLGETI